MLKFSMFNGEGAVSTMVLHQLAASEGSLGFWVLNHKGTNVVTSLLQWGQRAQQEIW